MAETVTVLVDRCTMQINLEPFFGSAPMPNIRKLFKYLFQEPWRNEETIKVLADYFPERTAKAKDAWGQASVEYTNGYVDTTLRWGIPPREKRAIERQNKNLLAKVKTAKRKYERWVKITDLYLELINKNTECTE